MIAETIFFIEWLRGSVTYIMSLTGFRTLFRSFVCSPWGPLFLISKACTVHIRCPVTGTSLSTPFCASGAIHVLTTGRPNFSELCAVGTRSLGVHYPTSKTVVAPVLLLLLEVWEDRWLFSWHPVIWNISEVSKQLESLCPLIHRRVSRSEGLWL